jgi:MarR-like DNA-binding transcriptional regulator SgrR of sgrS sRNA
MFLITRWRFSLTLASLAAAVNLIFSTANANPPTPAGSMKIVRTYMNFSEPIDPANIVTMADLELSIALATPLVVFNRERQIVAGLAEKWSVRGTNQLVFTLRAGAKWSDGSKIVASEYKSALERAKHLYQNDLKALFDALDRIETPDDRTIVFTTEGDVVNSGLLLKLTEPMYGLVAVKGDKIDLSKSSGAFAVKADSINALTLIANPYWYSRSDYGPELVEIRRPKVGSNVMTDFEKDPWPNLVSGTSLMPAESMGHIKALGYKTWQRSLDKVYALFPSKRFLQNGGAAFIKSLNTNIDSSSLTSGLAGLTKAEQFFPRGYVLYSAIDAKVKPVAWPSHRSIKLSMLDNPVLAPIRNELVRASAALNHAKMDVETFPLSKLDEKTKSGDFDILAISLAVADPNFEGAMSFFIERVPSFIQSTAEHNFAQQLTAARKLPNSGARAEAMRGIIVQAQLEGHVLPLFHFSSLAVAKPGVDLSEIPNSDETVIFSKVRMR